MLSQWNNANIHSHEPQSPGQRTSGSSSQFFLFPPTPTFHHLSLSSTTPPSQRQADGFIESTWQGTEQLKWIPAKEICEADDNVRYTFRAFLCGS